MDYTQELKPYLSQLDINELEECYSYICDYEATPVHINEFLDSEHYLGNYFGGKLRSYWRDVLNEIYPSPFYSPYYLVALRGSIGQGKTTAACVGMAYDLHKLMCMKVPQTSLGIIPTSKIVFVIFNMTLSLATDVVWDKMSHLFRQSPYFSRLIGPLLVKRRDRDTLLPKRVDFNIGSRMGHSLGKDVHSAILSEANFEVIHGQVYKSFNSLLTRMESRFMDATGSIPGKIWIDTSESDKSSVVNRIVDQYRNKSGVYVSQAALWEVIPEKYSGETFSVYVGSEVRPPEIISDDNVIKKAEPENCIEVPKEHFDRFEADVHASLRDLAGRSTGSSYKLFRLKDRLAQAVKVSRLLPDTIRLDFDDDSDQISNYITVPGYFANSIRKAVPRCIHIDIGLTGDRLGIGCAYVGSFSQRKYRDPHTFKEIKELAPNVLGEWAVGIEPTPGKQVPLYKIRLFLQWLTQQGYVIGWITSDGFQCFTGDTKISLLNGKEVPIKDLQGKDEFWVYSCDRDGNIVPGRGHNCRKTGKKAPILKVTLDNGEEIRCTHDHRFLLRDNTYLEAKHLKEGDSLMPLYRRDNFNYEQYYNLRSGNWIYTHVDVGRFKYPNYVPSRYGDPEGNKIHHLDFDSKNNDPNNLELCENQSDHMLRFHKDNIPEGWSELWENKEWAKSKSEYTSNQLKEQWKNEDYRNKITPQLLEAGKKGAQNLERREKARQHCLEMNKTGDNNRKSWLTRELVIDKYNELKAVYKVADYFGVHRETIRERLRDYPRYHNHKIIKIENAGYEDVYDFEVDEHHNFALSAGVFVHNSSDMIQSLKKMGYNAELLSMDRNSIPYVGFRDLVYEGRCFLPVNELMKKELGNLEVTPDGTKVDHPEKFNDGIAGSKDVADAIGGASFTALQKANEVKIYHMSDVDEKSAGQEIIDLMGWGDV